MFSESLLGQRSMEQTKRLLPRSRGRDGFGIEIFEILRGKLRDALRQAAELSSGDLEWIHESVAARRKDCVLRHRHWGASLLILPQYSIKPRCSGSIGPREIHPRRNLRARSLPLVGLVDQPVLLVAVIRAVRRLISGSGK